MERSIITLTTDFGTKDGYVAVMKGVILNINPETLIVDISHEIPHHDIVEARYIVERTYGYFPEKTIHLAVVDPGVGGTRRPILIGLLLIGWEKLTSQVPGFLRRLTIMDYMLSIFPASRGPKFILKGRLPSYYAVMILILIVLLFIWRSIAYLKEKEISA